MGILEKMRLDGKISLVTREARDICKAIASALPRQAVAWQSSI